MTFNGLNLSLGNLSRLSPARTRSISPENATGEPGQGGRHFEPAGPGAGLGLGWKMRPSVAIAPGQTRVLAEIAGSGAIQQIWMTPRMAPRCDYRDAILRMYWDEEQTPSVEVPVGDFFASAYTSFEVFAQLNSLAVCVNPGNAFNCYWEMPFRGAARITLENTGPAPMEVYYQINHTLTDVPPDAAYFHAQFRRRNPLGYKEVYPILDGIRGQGHYVGTYLAWQVNNNRWWGEGEIKFFLDGDIPAGKSLRDVAEYGGDCFPTICGTGTEDYFCGSYNFEIKTTRQYQEFSTAYAGMPHVVRPDGAYQANTRFSLYRWHIMDPIRFTNQLDVTIQALGWRRDGRRFLPGRDDISSVAYWYQTEPHAPFPQLPSPDELEIV
ncbi:MAG: glycoside hydrolase family 172 protein [Candidatus Nanopelagicales bacterium]